MSIERYISAKLIEYEAIAPEDEDLYCYAVHCLFLAVIPFVISMVIGVLLGKAPECLWIVVPFMLMRKFSGGHHAKTQLRCFLESSCAMYVAIEASVFLTDGSAVRIGMVLAVLWLAVFSPIDSENRRLSSQQKKVYKRTAITISMVFVLLYGILSVFHWWEAAVSVAIGIILCAVMQMPCLFKDIRMKLKNE